MSGINSQINFNVSAKDDASPVFQKIGYELDALAKKQLGITGEGAGASGAASEKQIKKALRGGGLDDVLEGFISKQAAEKAVVFGAIIKGVEAAVNGLATALDSIAAGKSNKDAFVDLYTSAAKSLPIIGGLAGATERLGTALGDYLSNAKQLREQAAEQTKGIAGTRAFTGSVADKSRSAADQEFLRQSPDKQFGQAQLDFRDKMADIKKQREEAKARGLDSGEIKKQIDQQENAARMQLVEAQAQQADKANKEAVAKYMEAEKEKTRIAKEQQDERDKAAEEQSRVQDAIFAKQIDVENQIADIEARKAAETERQQQKISSEVRRGALAEGGGIGTANQLASRERASFNPMLNVLKEQSKKDDEKISYLRKLYELLSRGTDPASIFT